MNELSKSEEKLPEEFLQNLDGMNADELREYAEEVIVYARQNDNSTCRLLAEYALLKSDAMYCRTKGHIKSALRLEDECDTVYKQLPEWARW